MRGFTQSLALLTAQVYASDYSLTRSLGDAVSYTLVDLSSSQTI